MNSSYEKLLCKHRRVQVMKARRNFIFEQFSNNRLGLETALKDLMNTGMGKEEASEKLANIQKAIDSIN